MMDRPHTSYNTHPSPTPRGYRPAPLASRYFTPRHSTSLNLPDQAVHTTIMLLNQNNTQPSTTYSAATTLFTTVSKFHWTQRVCRPLSRLWCECTTVWGDVSRQQHPSATTGRTHQSAHPREPSYQPGPSWPAPYNNSHQSDTQTDRYDVTD